MNNGGVAKAVTLVAFALALSVEAYCADFTIRVISPSEEVPQGAPVFVTVEICNVSGHPITVAKGQGGFMYQLSVVRADGRPRKHCKPLEAGTWLRGFSAEVLPADWKQARVEDITCDDVPGDWIVQARIICHGPYESYSGAKRLADIDAWSGEIASEEVRIRILQPKGTDLEAFNYLKGCPRCDNELLLARYPSSTYAGYALRACQASFGCVTYDCFDDPDGNLHKECDRGGGEAVIQSCMAKERATMRAYAMAAGRFLESHPDFFDAPRIRRQYAYCLAFTGDRCKAYEQVAILSKGEGPIAEEAKTFLRQKEQKQR